MHKSMKKSDLSTLSSIATTLPQGQAVYLSMPLKMYKDLLASQNIQLYAKNRGGLVMSSVARSVEINGLVPTALGVTYIGLHKQEDAPLGLVIADGNHRARAILSLDERSTEKLGNVDVGICVISQKDFIKQYQLLNAATGHTSSHKLRNDETPVGMSLKKFATQNNISDKYFKNKVMDETFALLITLEKLPKSGTIPNSVEDLHELYKKSSNVAHYLNSIKPMVFTDGSQSILAPIVQLCEVVAAQVKAHGGNPKLYSTGFIPLMFYLQISGRITGLTPDRIAQNLIKMSSGGKYRMAWTECLHVISRKCQTEIDNFRGREYKVDNTIDGIVKLASWCAKGKVER